LEHYDEEYLRDWNYSIAEFSARSLWRRAQLIIRIAKKEGNMDAQRLTPARDLLEKSLSGSNCAFFVFDWPSL
jgi:hypothetical protein